MSLFNIWVASFLVLIARTSLAYPFHTRFQSLTLTNDASPSVISPVNLADLAQGYPIYPTTCFPLSQRGHHVPPPALAKLISDCSWIINEVLLKQDGLLFQDLLFTYDCFKDQSGNQYLSRWDHGRCVINVASVEKHQTQTLQLFNTVLAANKILKECIEDHRLPQGGTTLIGPASTSFYVGILGIQDDGAANESNISLSSNLDPSRRGTQRSILPTMSNTEKAGGDYDPNDSFVSHPSSVNIEKRASDLQHGSSLSPGTQDLVPGGALSISDLALPSTNVSRSVKAPPSYPVTCFNPYSVKLKPAAVEDCQFIINQIILRYPNPMHQQTFGYTASADIDLSLPQNESWRFGSCIMFVRNGNKTRTDTFRMVDVAYTAHMIMTECVVGVKYPVGGSADIGSVADNFYVGVGGISVTDAANASIMQ